ITLHTSAPNTSQKLKFADLDGGSDAVLDADVIGRTMPLNVATSDTSSVGTFFRVGSAGGFNIVHVNPAGWDSDPNQDGISDTDPAVNFAAVKSFRVAGFNPTPDATAIGGNGGRGALIGLAVVPRVGNTEGVAIINFAADKGVA